MANAGGMMAIVLFNLIYHVLVAVESWECSNIDFKTFNPCLFPSHLKLPYGQCGSVLDSIQNAADAPKVIFEHAEPTKKYILIMVDPDAPSRLDPKMGFWRHWMVTDVLGKNLLSGDEELYSEVLTGYEGPLPPIGSGLHRYQFLLFKQPSSFNSRLLMLEKGSSYQNSFESKRGKFDVDSFVYLHGLCRLLVAAYEYQASVDIIEVKK